MAQITLNSTGVASSGTLALQSNGTTTAVTIDTSQNVGIGTASPNASYKMSITGNSASIYSGILFTDTNAGGGVFSIYGESAALKFRDSSAGATRMVIDSSGNVGIGTSSPAVKLDVAATTAVVQMDSSSGTAGAAVNRYKASNRTWVTGVNATDNTGAYTVYDVTASAERMRIDSSGNLLVGTTSLSQRLSVTAATEVGGFQNTSGTGNVRFYNSGGSTLGYIQWSGSSTSYNTSSDYRLKEDIQPMTGALVKVTALKPCTYKWKVDGSAGQGFIAHELQEVVSGCVTGEKDAVDAEGNPVYQGIDTSFLVATLTAAIQEQQAIITSLTDRITALEAK